MAPQSEIETSEDEMLETRHEYYSEKDDRVLFRPSIALTGIFSIPRAALIFALDEI
jgi:hypothetical protein